jgi:hypothetical protein
MRRLEKGMLEMETRRSQLPKSTKLLQVLTVLMVLVPTSGCDQKPQALPKKANAQTKSAESVSADEFKDMDQGLFDGIRALTLIRTVADAHFLAENYGFLAYGRLMSGRRDLKELQSYRDLQTSLADKLNLSLKQDTNLVEALKNGWSYGFDKRLKAELESQMDSLKRQIDGGDKTEIDVYETLKREIQNLSQKIEHEKVSN